MNKTTTYLLVNCGRVFEGTLRNLLPPAYSVRSASREEIERCLFFRPQTAPGGSSFAQEAKSDAGGMSLSDAKNAVAAMLSKPAASAKEETLPKENNSCAGFIDPDCIIYHLSDGPETDLKMVRDMRRKCRFRDIPILLATTYAELPRARSLLSGGADDIVIVPGDPAALQKKAVSVLEPVGSRMPIITKVINPYIGAAVDLLGTMAGLHAEKKEVFLKRNYRLFGDISGIMSFTGRVEGQVVVCFEEKLAREVVARIMSSRPEDLTKDELREGIGEVVNIIAGNAKAVLATTEYQHQIGLPTVATGRGHEVSHPGNAPCIVVIFDVGGQPMAVLVCMAIK